MDLAKDYINRDIELGLEKVYVISKHSTLYNNFKNIRMCLYSGNSFTPLGMVKVLGCIPEDEDKFIEAISKQTNTDVEETKELIEDGHLCIEELLCHFELIGYAKENGEIISKMEINP